MPEPSAASAKLIQYLNEAYGTEQRLETALQAHIAMTTRTTYKKRLQQHLSETKRHGRDVSRRIKQLGGSVEGAGASSPGVVTGVVQGAVAATQKGVALAQGPLHALRGTGEAEKQLKNAKTEYASESEEIATYSAIETLADAVGDRDTRQLARTILKEEQRMRSFLEKEIPRLTAAVVKDEIPASERGSSRRSSRSSTRRKTSATAGGRSASSRSTAGRSATTRSGSASRSATTKRSTSGTAAKRTSASGARSRSATRSTRSAGASRSKKS